jgi:hypothetical protein
MINDLNKEAAFPQERSKKLTERKAIWLTALFGVMACAIIGGVIGGIAGYHETSTGNTASLTLIPWALVATGIVIGLSSLVWGLKYWRAIDEMARRAHLDSWFWGGVVGSLPLLTIGMVALAFPDFNITFIQSLAKSPTHAFGLGAVGLYTSMLLGYGLTWLIWWAKKR